MSIRSVLHEFNHAWHDQMNIIKKSGKRAYKDTIGLGTGIGFGIGVHDAKKAGMKTFKAAGSAAKGLGVGSAVEFLLRFGANEMKNQLAYLHGTFKK